MWKEAVAALSAAASASLFGEVVQHASHATEEHPCEHGAPPPPIVRVGAAAAHLGRREERLWALLHVGGAQVEDVDQAARIGGALAEVLQQCEGKEGGSVVGESKRSLKRMVATARETALAGWAAARRTAVAARVWKRTRVQACSACCC